MSRSLALAALALALVGLPACGGGGGSGTDAAPESEFPPTDAGATGGGGDYFTQGPIDVAIEDPSAFLVGIAVVSPTNETTTTIAITMDDDSGRAAELRNGQCWTGEKGEVVRELGRIENRELEATVEQPFDELLEAEHSLVVVGEGGKDVGCGLIAAFGAGS